MSDAELCPCGRPLHYANPIARTMVEGVIAGLGPTVDVLVGERGWKVPRHYIALHGVHGRDLPALAEQHGWEKVE
jgi:hypothetical protein